MRKQIGTIHMGSNLLDGASATFVRRTGTGRSVVILNERRGAYLPGEIVIVGPGEWKRD